MLHVVVCLLPLQLRPGSPFPISALCLAAAVPAMAQTPASIAYRWTICQTDLQGRRLQRHPPRASDETIGKVEEMADKIGVIQ